MGYTINVEKSFKSKTETSGKSSLSEQMVHPKIGCIVSMHWEYYYKWILHIIGIVDG